MDRMKSDEQIAGLLPGNLLLVDQLCDLRADPILISAALHGQISSLECRFVDEGTCLCPDGTGFFTKRGSPRNNPWAPSADRWPVPGRDGGEYVIENVRLAHFKCNVVAGSRAMQMRWRGTLEQRAWSSRPKPGNGYATQAKWRGTPEQRSWMAKGDKSVGGRIGMCKRWNVNRGKPCVCGQHSTVTPA